MTTKFFRNVLLILCIVITVACGLPESQDVTPTAPPTEEVTTGAPPTEIAIQHEVIPIDLPGQESGQAADFDSSIIPGSDYFIGGDRFTYGRFERPFNANTMDIYFPEIDINHTMVLQDDIWVYGIIVMNDLSANQLQDKKYGVELDTTLNGKGDFLILTTLPTTQDWAVDGVQIYADQNQDVGGNLPYQTDENITPGDGFEAQIFNSGQGDDPDAAWVRLSPNFENSIEVAIKKSAIGNPAAFMINMWAGTKALDPALFDLNDRFTHEEAGAADEGLEFYYPIKALAEIDNSCRMAVGFQPTGKEAGICATVQQAAPEIPGTSSTPGKPIIILHFPCIPVSCPADSYWDDASCGCKTVR